MQINEKKNKYFARETRGHITPRAKLRQRRCRTQDITGGSRQCQLSESNSDTMNKERASLLGWEAGWRSEKSSYRVIERARGEIAKEEDR